MQIMHRRGRLALENDVMARLRLARDMPGLWIYTLNISRGHDFMRFGQASTVRGIQRLGHISSLLWLCSFALLFGGLQYEHQALLDFFEHGHAGPPRLIASLLSVVPDVAIRTGFVGFRLVDPT